MTLASLLASGGTPRRSHGRGRLFLAFAATALLAGCAHVPLATPEADAQAKRFQPPDGKALIYVFRDSLVAAPTLFPVYADQERVGDLAPWTYYVLEVEPGPHLLAFPFQFGAVTLRLRVEAGRRYFVRQWLERFETFLVDTPRLAEVEEELGRPALGHLVRVVRLQPHEEEDRLARELQPPAAGALVCVFRWAWVGAGTDLELEVNGRPAGRLAVRTFVTTEVDPGEVLVKLRGDDEPILSLRIPPGGVAYVEASPLLKRKLRQVDEAGGKAMIAELRLAARP